MRPSERCLKISIVSTRTGGSVGRLRLFGRKVRRSFFAKSVPVHVTAAFLPAAPDQGKAHRFGLRPGVVLDA